jgi:hypothetical protein
VRLAPAVCMERYLSLLPGSARGLVPPAVFPVSLPCHWGRRFEAVR